MAHQTVVVGPLNCPPRGGYGSVPRLAESFVAYQYIAEKRGCGLAVTKCRWCDDTVVRSTYMISYTFCTNVMISYNKNEVWLILVRTLVVYPLQLSYIASAVASSPGFLFFIRLSVRG